MVHEKYTRKLKVIVTLQVFHFHPTIIYITQGGVRVHIEALISKLYTSFATNHCLFNIKGLNMHFIQKMYETLT